MDEHQDTDERHGRPAIEETPDPNRGAELAPSGDAASCDAAAPCDAAPEQAPAAKVRAAGAGEAEIAAVVEAILFSSDSPMAAGRIAQVAELQGQRAVREAVRSLNQRYEQMGCAFRIEEIGGGFQMLTLGQYHDVLGRLFKARGESKLSQAALETLAIIAYRQPILRADVEAIRGVASGEVLRGLMEKQLVKIVGRAEVLGRPMLYGTTRRFLDVFGLGSLEDLPRVEELRSGAKSADSSAQAPAPAPASPSEPAPATTPTPTEPAPEPAPTTTESPESS
jgi:segregation and condensation protein B